MTVSKPYLAVKQEKTITLPSPGSARSSPWITEHAKGAVGICKGVISDGLIAEREVGYLKQWLQRNHEIVCVWPARELAGRLGRILADGKVTEEEKAELLQFLQLATGETPPDERNPTAGNPVTKLPLDSPPPEVEFLDRCFCFTGKFVSGTRDWCERETQYRGGINGTALKCHFLVVGSMVSRDWAHTSHGRKMEAAMARRSTGAWPKVVVEEHWAKFLQETPVLR